MKAANTIRKLKILQLRQKLLVRKFPIGPEYTRNDSEVGCRLAHLKECSDF